MMGGQPNDSSSLPGNGQPAVTRPHHPQTRTNRLCFPLTQDPLLAVTFDLPEDITAWGFPQRPVFIYLPPSYDVTEVRGPLSPALPSATDLLCTFVTTKKSCPSPPPFVLLKRTGRR